MTWNIRMSLALLNNQISLIQGPFYTTFGVFNVGVRKSKIQFTFFHGFEQK